ncbi:MBOAT family O-acyltransferase, partial [Helicobacter jaachi]|uniref:MBOAT family O-acyltransferase n=1 Tax=Helicobacter jaachi TaxID=1677920 RepID=UPI001EE8A4FE
MHNKDINTSASYSLGHIHFLDYCLFITFFPQLIAGPIVHHKEMMPQFEALQYTKTLPYKHIAKGLFIFAIGLFKKVCIADYLGVWANAGFNATQNGVVLNSIESWACALSYSFELYFDFSGYCDMAIGLGLLFGIMLPINFNSPYKALNITDFWRRWHITLGRFLRDYIYIPLGGSKNERYKYVRFYNVINKLLTLRNLFIVSVISGIWHGAGYGFIIWGVLHGLALIIHRIYIYSIDAMKYRICKYEHKNNKEHAHNAYDVCDNRYKERQVLCNSFINANSKDRCKDKYKWRGDYRSFIHCSRVAQEYVHYVYIQILKAFLYIRTTLCYKALCLLLTFNFINIAWIFFRSENVQGAINLLKGMFGGVIILPNILEPYINKITQYINMCINAIGLDSIHMPIHYGKWANAIVDSSLIVWSMLVGAFIICVGFKNV